MRASGSFEDAQLLANSGLARSYIPVNSAFLKLWMHSKSSIPRIADDLFSKIEKKNLILSFQYIHMLVAIKSCPFSLVTSGLCNVLIQCVGKGLVLLALTDQGAPECQKISVGTSLSGRKNLPPWLEKGLKFILS